MASELGTQQISTLLETLPGIANVLRSPVADALLNVIRAAARLTDFAVEDAEELVRYATRRGLLGMEEGERLLQDVHAADQRRHDKAVQRAKDAKARARGKPKPRPKPHAKAKAAKKPARKRR
ncbi:MAG TPA: hypothetical protein VFS28_03545 [Gemmatimonadales bacterium]|nr:hypothetical protein [Gemmatimonadales bacterium]